MSFNVRTIFTQTDKKAAGRALVFFGVDRKTIITVFVGAVAAMAVGTAHADPTPAPGPYVIQGPGGPTVGGMRTLPPVCLAQPRSCAMDWDPNSGTWTAPPPS